MYQQIQSGHASTRQPGLNINSPQLQQPLKWIMATNPVMYLQLLQHQAERVAVQCPAERQYVQGWEDREAAQWHKFEVAKLQSQLLAQSLGSPEHRV